MDPTNNFKSIDEFLNHSTEYLNVFGTVGISQKLGYDTTNQKFYVIGSGIIAGGVANDGIFNRAVQRTCQVASRTAGNITDSTAVQELIDFKVLRLEEALTNLNSGLSSISKETIDLETRKKLSNVFQKLSSLRATLLAVDVGMKNLESTFENKGVTKAKFQAFQNRIENMTTQAMALSLSLKLKLDIIPNFSYFGTNSPIEASPRKLRAPMPLPTTPPKAASSEDSDLSRSTLEYSQFSSSDSSFDMSCSFIPEDENGNNLSTSDLFKSTIGSSPYDDLNQSVRISSYEDELSQSNIAEMPTGLMSKIFSPWFSASASVPAVSISTELAEIQVYLTKKANEENGRSEYSVNLSDYKDLADLEDKTGILRKAIQLKDKELISLLMKAGADLTKLDKFGTSAITIAMIEDAFDLVQPYMNMTLIFEMQKFNLLQAFFSESDEAKIDHFLQHHKHLINVKDRFGETLFFYCCENFDAKPENFSKNIQLLLTLKKHGANVNEKNNRRVSPLKFLAMLYKENLQQEDLKKDTVEHRRRISTDTKFIKDAENDYLNQIKDNNLLKSIIGESGNFEAIMKLASGPTPTNIDRVAADMKSGNFQTAYQLLVKTKTVSMPTQTGYEGLEGLTSGQIKYKLRNLEPQVITRPKQLSFAEFFRNIEVDINTKDKSGNTLLAFVSQKMAKEHVEGRLKDQTELHSLLVAAGAKK